VVAVAMVDGFLGRWSQRKQAQRAGLPLDEPPTPTPAAVSTLAPIPAIAAPVPGAPSAAETVAQPAPEPAPPPPSLEDARQLTPASDFRPFMARDVAPEVRNAAMKKLFADPQFNVMDRLDTYIDDYSLPDPLPASMLRQMASAQFLKLFDDDNEAETPQSPEPDHDHTDLRLQPNHAAGQGEPGGGAQRDADAA
jgi:hypothetical protein